MLITIALFGLFAGFCAILGLAFQPLTEGIEFKD